ncbi:MAG: flagellar hook protein FlgE [Dehalococcoidia bacterium]
MFSAISGLQNHLTFMDVIGNNIANINTIAFKANRVTFQDVLGQTIRGATAPGAGNGGTDPIQVGLGMQLGGIKTLHTQGSLQATGKLTDFAIQGDGFFLLNDSARTFYTRDGSFDVSISGDLVNPVNGFRVQGWNADENGNVDTTAPVTAISIAFGTRVSAKRTTSVGLSGNLDAAQPIGKGFSTTVTIFDSLGVQNSVKLSFTKKAANEWTVTNSANVTAVGTTLGVGSIDSIAGTPTQEIRPGVWDITSDVAGTLSAVFTPTGGAPEPAISGTIAAGGTNTTMLSGMTLTNAGVLRAGTDQITIGGGTDVSFSTSGQYLATNPAISVTLTLSNGADSPQNVNIDLSDLSQFAGAGQIATTSSDGFPAGSLVSFAVGTGGDVTGIFSNGSNQLLGQLALAQFTNPAGLAKEGNNLFSSTSNSGEPIIGVPGSGGRGVVSTGALEGSNTDLASEFTNVILAQRGFQASARVITAADEMLADLVNIRR